MLVQEACNLVGADVFPAFEKTAGKSRDRMCVCLDELCEHRCKLDLVFEVGNGLGVVGEQGRQRMEVVVVDLRYIRVGDDDEWQIP